MLRGKETTEKMWTISKFYTKHTCDMGDLPDDHCNLGTNMIARVLVGDIGKNSRFPIKDCITAVLKVYSKTVTRRKAYLGRRRAHEIVYGNWEGSFKKLRRYMAALQHFNHGTVVEWKLKSKPGVLGNIFDFVFWAFKSCIDGFAHCRHVISIDGTHVYGKYDIKLLIAVGIDANGAIFPLDFAILGLMRALVRGVCFWTT
ncbi:uncharacterized protein LOC132062149 [Lycium ferocissimum]|uniref:uncharacterized protein LOC132062149 n=1 Tax=Lycium ferocissimum TaxID=112874 RepID=UPI00281634C8|nr:uncharacterized protein LOC132062149 [Lycium ferocissimum]